MDTHAHAQQLPALMTHIRAQDIPDEDHEKLLRMEEEDAECARDEGDLLFDPENLPQAEGVHGKAIYESRKGVLRTEDQMLVLQK